MDVSNLAASFGLKPTDLLRALSAVDRDAASMAFAGTLPTESIGTHSSSDEFMETESMSGDEIHSKRLKIEDQSDDGISVGGVESPTNPDWDATLQRSSPLKSSNGFRTELKRPDLKGSFRCTLCQKVFCHSSSLSRHRMQAHFKSYTCTLCSKEINNNETLRDHMRKQHQIRPFMCRCCNWAFPDKTSLHMHMQGQQEGKTVNVPVVGKGNPPMGTESPSTPPFAGNFAVPTSASTPSFPALNPVAAAMALALNQSAASTAPPSIPSTPIQPTPLFPSIPQMPPLFPHLSQIQPDNTDLLSKIGGRLFFNQLWQKMLAAQSEDSTEMIIPTSAPSAPQLTDFGEILRKHNDNNNTVVDKHDDNNNNNDQTRSHNEAEEEQSPTNTQTSASPAAAHYDFPKNSTPTLQENCRCGFGDEVRQLRVHNEYLMQKLVECRERIVVSLRSEDARSDLLHDLLKITFMD